MNKKRKSVALTKKQKSILIGTLLGDGYLNKRGSNVRLQLVHGPKQEEYIKWKYENLKNICTERGLQFNTYKDKYSKTGIKQCWNFYSKSHDFLVYLHEKVYTPNKNITEEILDKLDPLALAVWIMDDGSLQKRKGRLRTDGIRKYVGARFVLCTYTKDLNIEQLICKKLKEKFDLNFQVQKHYDNYRLYCTTEDFKKLASLIKPFVIDSMKYKIDISFLGKDISS